MTLNANAISRDPAFVDAMAIGFGLKQFGTIRHGGGINVAAFEIEAQTFGYITVRLGDHTRLYR